MQCAEVREILPAFSSDGEVSLAARRHLSRCADCKRELAQYEAMSSVLRRLESSTVEPPAGLKYVLESIPQRADRTEVVRAHLQRNRNAYLGGAAAAVAVVGAVGAAVWRSRRTGPATA